MENVTRDNKQTDFPNREQFKSDAADVMDKAKQTGQQKLESGKETAADQAKKVAGVFEQASAQFQQSDLQTLADYSTSIANTIIKFSDDLRNRNIDDFLRDTHAVARRNPTMFLLGSVAVGFAISRFFKASAERPRQEFRPEIQHQGSESPISEKEFSPDTYKDL